MIKVFNNWLEFYTVVKQHSNMFSSSIRIFKSLGDNIYNGCSCKQEDRNERIKKFYKNLSTTLSYDDKNNLKLLTNSIKIQLVQDGVVFLEF